MQKTLREALQACATFNFTGDSSAAKVLALLPGIYSAMKDINSVTTTKADDGNGGDVDVVASVNAAVTFSDPTNLVNAGYFCDQVADDYNSADSGQYVHVTGANRVKYRDFLNTVQRVGINVTKIVIQNKVSSQDIFDQEIQIARTAIGAKGGMDFIQLQNYVSVNAYDRSKITIDLTDEPLFLTPEVFMAMNVPANASFSMQFFFEAPALGGS